MHILSKIGKSMDEVVEEIMVLHMRFPTWPSMEEVEATLSMIETMGNNKVDIPDARCFVIM
jgi:hypothetical protein